MLFGCLSTAGGIGSTIFYNYDHLKYQYIINHENKIKITEKLIHFLYIKYTTELAQNFKNYMQEAAPQLILLFTNRMHNRK